MKVRWFLPMIFPVFADCHPTPTEACKESVLYRTPPGRVADIPLPDGFTRTEAAASSFAYWLQQVALKKDNKVYLYNGRLKNNQEAQFAVLDIPVGDKDLQQCADAVMRLRAEYLFAQKRFNEISFADNNGKKYNCPPDPDRKRFERYLEQVFIWCGTASLEKQLRPVKSFGDLQPGDVLIRGGFPGHVAIVMDMAQNAAGKKIYLLAQSYMPAQDIHILRNPGNTDLSPWYELNDNSLIYSPEWTFSTKELKRWPGE